MPVTGIIEDGVRDKLLATAGVTALVSQRIWSGKAPESAARDTSNNQRTYVVIQKDPSGTHKEQSMAGATTLAMASLSIGAYGPTYESARNVANAIVAAIDGLRGAFGSEYVSFCMVKDVIQAEAAPVRDDEVGVPGYALAVDIAYFTA